MSKQAKSSSPAKPSKTRFWQTSWGKNGLTVVLFVGLFLLLRPLMQGDVIEGQAPVIKGQSITGKAINLKQTLQQGKPVLVHFWATWCPICEFSRDGVEAISEDYPVLNIATQSGDDAQLHAYAQQHDMNASLIVNDFDGKLMQQFGPKAVPAGFIIAPNGEIEFIEVGFTSAWGLRLRLWLASW